MSLLKEAILTLREPITEGRGIKVFLIEKDELTDAHIKKLRQEYNKVDKVDPENPVYKQLTKFLDGQSQKRLKQLAGAKIKFVSALARNRLTEAEDGQYYMSLILAGRASRKIKDVGIYQNLDDALKAARKDVSRQGNFGEIAMVLRDMESFGSWKNARGETIWDTGSDETGYVVKVGSYPTVSDVTDDPADDEEEEKKVTLNRPQYSRKQRQKRRDKIYQKNRRGLPQTFDVTNKPWRKGHR